MSFVAVAIGGSALVSAGVGLYGANKAADTQANAANNALNFQKQAFDTSQANLRPFINAGQNATYTLGQLTGSGTNNQPDYSSFFKDPSYQFAQQQGELGIRRAADATGTNLSGGTLKDLTQFNSGLASQQYGNYFNRLMGLSTMGANAAAGGATNATAASGAIGNTMQGVGQAQASGYVGGANALSSGINSGVSNSLLYNALNRNSSAYGGSNSATGGLDLSKFTG